MEAKSWDKLLPNVNETGRDLISQLVRYSGSQRLKAEQVCGFISCSLALLMPIGA